MKRRAGFTLIETMAVVLGLSLVMVTVFSIYGTVLRQATVSAEATEGPRRATALLDRMARDLSATVLVAKPDAVDPIDHPWVFLAESRLPSPGAEQLRFQTRSHRPRASEAHASDLIDVAWFLSPQEDEEGHQLLRWSSTQLPERLERDFPRRDADGVEVSARGVADFGIHWLAEDGSWVEEWDSSTLQRSSQTPIAAEIRVAFLSEDEDLPPISFQRRVNLALRPIDLEALLQGEDGAGALGPEEADSELEDEDEPPGEEPFPGPAPNPPGVP